jgi:hypothetical protein
VPTDAGQPALLKEARGVESTPQHHCPYHQRKIGNQQTAGSRREQFEPGHFARSLREYVRQRVKGDPPQDVAETILARAGEWGFPNINGVLATPMLRPDGSVLSVPGYDEATQLLLFLPPSLPEMPADPTRDDALAALGLLDGLLAEFPFVDDPSRSVAPQGRRSAQINRQCQ